MFDINNNKMFMDTIHGYISIPKVFVDNIVDTEFFQRLHNINQTGMSVLYPGGKHDRYSHSLGVYFLGLKAVDSLLNNFRANMYWNIKSDNTCDVFWAKNKVLFLIACLLHDIGHAPFSHSLEKHILENSRNLKFELSKKFLMFEPDERVKDIEIQSAPHEIIGSLLVFEQLRESIKNILDELCKDKYPNTKQQFLSEYAKEPPVIDSNNLDEDLCFIVRMILGLKYKSYKPEKQMQNCFIELLNGKNFDVDKLDYIIRDTKMSGISNINIDVERLLNSLTLVTLTEYNNFSFDNYHVSDIFVKEIKSDVGEICELSGYLDATIELEENCEIVIGDGSENITLEPFMDLSQQLRKDAQIDILEYTDFNKASVLCIDEAEIPFDSERKVFPINKAKNVHVIIRDATIQRKTGFVFKVSHNKYELRIKGKCDLNIKGKARINFAKFDGIINGCCKRVCIIGDILKKHNQIPTSCAYNTFSVGFKKQSINLLSNVLEARDYLYLWIYAHHKVIYYANFLIPHLAKMLEKYMQEETFPKWSLDYDHIALLDDDYFVTALKFLYKENQDKLQQFELDFLKEFFSRKYKNSLYKSLAEYDLFFDDFDISQKNNMKAYFDRKCSEASMEPVDSLNYGILPQEVIKEINSYNENVCLNSLIWVSANYSHKILNKLETYCVFPEETVTMEHLSLFKSQDRFSNRNTNHYFYLYYDAEKGDANEVKHVLLQHMKKVNAESVMH